GTVHEVLLSPCRPRLEHVPIRLLRDLIGSRVFYPSFRRRIRLLADSPQPRHPGVPLLRPAASLCSAADFSCPSPRFLPMVLVAPSPALRRPFALLLVGLLGLALAGCGVNNLPTLQEKAKAAWSEV